MSRIIHLTATKEYVLKAILSLGAGSVLGPTWNGRDAQAIRVIEAKPGSVLPVGKPCSAFDPEKGCTGHDDMRCSCKGSQKVYSPIAADNVVTTCTRCGTQWDSEGLAWP